MWVWRFIQTRLRSGDSRAKHGAIQRRRGVWSLFPAHLRQLKMVQTGRRSNPNNRHKFLPAELYIPNSLVQSAAEALRSFPIHVPEVRHLPGRRRSGEVPAGAVPQAGRDEVPDERKSVLDSCVGV